MYSVCMGLDEDWPVRALRQAMVQGLTGWQVVGYFPRGTTLQQAWEWCKARNTQGLG